MPDVLENLQKLPPRCVGEIDGKSVLIQRGVMGYVETHLSPGVYENIPVSPAQRQAMVVGCQLGWDKLGANPDIYEQTNDGEPIERRRFFYLVPFIMGCDFVHEAEALADADAEALADEVMRELQNTVVEKFPAVSSFTIDDQLQLVGSETENENAK